MTWRRYQKMLEYVAMLRAGSRVTVYYDPARPQRAVLDRRTSAWDYLLFIVTGLGLLVVGPSLFQRW